MRRCGVDTETAVQKILQEAAAIAGRLGATSYTTYHLLLALMRKDAEIREWLEARDVSMNGLLARAQEGAVREPFMGELMARVRRIARTAGIERSPIHLLYALLSFGDEGHARRLLGMYGNSELLQREIVRSGWLRRSPAPAQAHQDQEEEGSSSVEQPTALERHGTDYTELARQGKLRPIVGRQNEIREVIEILAHKDTGGEYDEAVNNPVLLGKAGVGKTAIAKGLACAIALRNPIAELFWGHRVVYVRLGSLQAGTGVRGSLEARLEAILADCTAQPTILFLDELHILMGLGKTEGSPGLEEILKPVLAEGLTCIGATTLGEWRKHVEPNEAFARRWIKVTIDEPSPEETLQILTGSVNTLARRHLVHFPPETLSKAVELGRKFMHDVASPAREIEQILNGVGAKVKIAHALHASVSDVVEKVSQVAHVSIALEEDERQNVAGAYDVLSRRIIGQEEACRELADAILRYRSGMANSEKPFVVLALGPTGHGKTHAARIMAELYYYSRMFRVDMSEFMEKHTVSKLIGAPPGYVGYSEPGRLTEPIRQLGVALGLVDEVEKAHTDVWNIFLQLFDEGKITDSAGREAHANNCLFLLTSNIGARSYFGAASGSAIGFRADNATEELVSFSQVRERVIAQAKKQFSPEFWNRLDAVVVFKPFNKQHVRAIAELLLNEEKEKCVTKGFELRWDNAVVDYLVSHGYSYEYGARPMKRRIMRHVQTLLAGPVYTQEIRAGDVVWLYMANNAIGWHK